MQIKLVYKTQSYKFSCQIISHKKKMEIKVKKLVILKKILSKRQNNLNISNLVCRQSKQQQVILKTNQ